MVLISRENRRKIYEYLLNEGVLVLKKVPFNPCFFLHFFFVFSRILAILPITTPKFPTSKSGWWCVHCTPRESWSWFSTGLAIILNLKPSLISFFFFQGSTITITWRPKVSSSSVTISVSPKRTSFPSPSKRPTGTSRPARTARAVRTDPEAEAAAEAEAVGKEEAEAAEEAEEGNN